MVSIYAIESRDIDDVLHIWIPANNIPAVPFIEEQLSERDIRSLANQIVATHRVCITYFGEDMDTLLQHLVEVYDFTYSQLASIILWCGERIPLSTVLKLLKKVRT